MSEKKRLFWSVSSQKKIEWGEKYCKVALHLSHVSEKNVEVID